MAKCSCCSSCAGSSRLLQRASFTAAHKFFCTHSNIARNFSQQNGRDISSFVKGHCHAAAICMSKLLVRAALTDLFESQPLEPRYQFLRFEDW